MPHEPWCYPHPMAITPIRALLPALLTGLLGCGEAESVDPTDCSAMAAGGERDRCLHEEIKVLGGDRASDVLEKASLIDDIMIRGAAVSGWISDHNAVVPPAEGQALCELLDGRDRSYCLRRLSSPHLQR